MKTKIKILDRYCRTADKKVMIDIAAVRVEDLYNDLDKYAPSLVSQRLGQNII